MSEIDRRFLLGTLAGAAGVSALASVARGGPLTPPTGPVASTGKTLTEVQPRVAVTAVNTPGDANAAFIISQAGSYYLTGNITASGPALDAIRVTAGVGMVTVDLNGFSITSYTNGVRATSGADLVVRNGAVLQCSNGITTVSTAELSHLTVEDMTFDACTLSVNAAAGLTMRRCVSFYGSGVNGQRAVTCGQRSLIENCQIQTTGVNNVLAGAFATVLNCSFSGSSAYSVDVGSGSLVQGCTFTNGNTGVHINAANAGGGIVRGCTFSGFNVAAVEAFGSLIEGNVIRTTGGSASPIGINASTACDVANNRIDGNFCNGIGIVAQGSRNTVRGNGVSNFTGGSAIGLTIAPASGSNNSGNKVDGNEFVNNNRHINVSAAYNLIVRNTMSFAGPGGNFNNTGTNAYGPFVLCGNTDLSTVAGTGHPQANLVY